MSKQKPNPFTHIFFIVLLALTAPLLSVFVIIALIQSLSVHLKGEPIDSLVIISTSLLSFFLHIIEYITYVRPTPPFPFSAWKNHYG